MSPNDPDSRGQMLVNFCDTRGKYVSPFAAHGVSNKHSELLLATPLLAYRYNLDDKQTDQPLDSRPPFEMNTKLPQVHLSQPVACWLCPCLSLALSVSLLNLPKRTFLEAALLDSS